MRELEKIKKLENKLKTINIISPCLTIGICLIMFIKGMNYYFRYDKVLFFDSSRSLGQLLLDSSFLLFFLIPLITIILNISIVIKMRNIYRKCEHDLAKDDTKVTVNKYLYLFLAITLGLLGIDRFLVQDNYGGSVRLLITFSSVLFLGLPLIVNFSFIMTDSMIAISKIPDENHKIVMN